MMNELGDHEDLVFKIRECLESVSALVTPSNAPVIRLKMRNILFGLILLILFCNIFSQTTCDNDYCNVGDPQIKIKSKAAGLNIYSVDNDLFFRLEHEHNERGPFLTGKFGVRIPPSLAPTELESCPAGEDVCFNWGSDDIHLGVHSTEDNCFEISWRVSYLRVAEDCFGKDCNNLRSHQ